MTYLLLSLTLPALCTIALWIDYLSMLTINAARKRGRITKESKPYARIALALGLWFDMVYNLTIGTLIFWDWPRELLLTHRLERYKFGHYERLLRKVNGRWRFVKGNWIPADPTNWRHKEAEYWCRVFLDPFEAECHCTNPRRPA